MHNTLYRLQKKQYFTLVFLGILFVITSFIWFLAELSESEFPFEPIVVLIGGLATLFAVFWPFRPTYMDRRISSKVTFDYTTNNGDFSIGREELSFTLHFTHANHENIHLYNYNSDIRRITVARDVGRISEIKDASAFHYSSDSITLSEGDIACVENDSGNYACIKIIDIKSTQDGIDNKNEVTFSYVINPDKGTDFS
ncbi:hypothetical protein F1642_14560 [Paracoccus sp. NBH48]|nr:hypothetical protein [Paracoccus sp. NBH48]MBF5080130.1 hypothetical protein [Paracoccus sp. NBH48]